MKNILKNQVITNLRKKMMVMLKNGALKNKEHLELKKERDQSRFPSKIMEIVTAMKTN